MIAIFIQYYPVKYIHRHTVLLWLLRFVNMYIFKMLYEVIIKTIINVHND